MSEVTNGMETDTEPRDIFVVVDVPEDISSEPTQDSNKTWAPAEVCVIAEEVPSGSEHRDGKSPVDDQIQDKGEVGEGTPGAVEDDITSTFSRERTEKGRRNIIQEDDKDFPEDTSKENFFQKLTISIILVTMVTITFLGVEEVANRGTNGNVTSTPATSSQYPAYSTTTVGIKWTETSRSPQVPTTHTFTTKGNSKTSQYTSTLRPVSTSHYPENNATTTVGINQTKPSTTPQQFTAQSTSAEETTTADPYTPEEGSSTSNLTSPTSLPGITTEGSDHYTTSLVTNHTLTTMLVQENTNSSIGENPTTGHEITTSTMENSTSLYTSSSLPESSNYFPEYNTTTVGINQTETSTPQQYTIHSTTVEEISTTDQYTTNPESSMSNLTSSTALPGTTTEGSDLNTTPLVTNQTEATTFVPGNPNPNSTIEKNPTAGIDKTTSSMENSTSLYTSTSLPESSSYYLEYNTTTVGINRTETTTAQQNTIHSTTTQETPTTDQHTSDPESPLPGITTEGSDHNSTPLVTNHTLTTMLVQENTNPNSTTEENPTTGHEITTSMMENSTSLYTSSLPPKSSSHYPDYNTTTVGINRTETTTPQQNTIHSTTTQETPTTDQHTSDPESSMSNLTSPTALPGITTEGSDLNSTPLVTNQVTNHTLTTMLVQENTNPNSTIGENPTTGHEITTSMMENSTSLYTSSLPPKSSSHYPDYNTTTVGINRTETTTAQWFTEYNTTTEETSTAKPYTSYPGSSASNLTSPTSLPGITTEVLDHITTTLVPSQTEATTSVPGNPNSTIGKNPTAGVDITTSSIKNSTILYTSTSLPESSSHYPKYNTTTVGINRTETTTIPQDYTIHSSTTQDFSTADQYTSGPESSMSNLTSSTSFPGITTEDSDHYTTPLVTNHTLTTMLVQENTNSTIGENPTTGFEIITSTMVNSTSLYTSSLPPKSSSHYPDYNTTTVGINRTEKSTPQQNTIHSTTVEEIYTTDQYTSDPGSTMTNLTSSTALPGTTTEGSDLNTTPLVTNQTEATTFVPGNPNSTIGKNPTAGVDKTTSSVENSTSLYTSTSLPESSSHYPEYNTTTVGINRTETTTPQQNTIHSTTTQETPTTDQHTSDPESPLPGITTEGSDHNSTPLVTNQVTNHTLTTMLVQENTNPNSTTEENPTTAFGITTSMMENSTSLYTSSLPPKSSSHYPDYNTTTVGINRTETTTAQWFTEYNTTTEETSTAKPYTSYPGSSASNLTSPTSLPGITTEVLDHITTTLVPSQTEATTSVPGNPNSTIGKNPTAGVDITTSSIKNSTILYTSTSLPESSSHYPKYNTTTVGINRTETTTIPQDYTIHSSTTQDFSTADQYTSGPESSMSNLTSSTSFPGITTEDSDHYTTPLVTNHTLTTMLVQENTNSTIGENPTTGFEIITSTMVNSTSLYTSSLPPKSSSHYPDYNTTTVGINRTEKSTPQQNTIHSTTVEEIYTTDQYTSDPGSTMTNLTSSTALPGTTTEGSDLNTTPLVTNQTEATTFVPGNPNSTIGKNPTAGVDKTTSSVENSTSLYTSTSLPESSSHYPEYNTTTVGINRTETTTPQQNTIHSTTTQETPTTDQHTSDPESPLPGITTEGSDHNSTPLVTNQVTNHTLTTMLVQENTNPNSTTEENPTTAFGITTSMMENSTSLYTSSLPPKSSSHYPDYNTTTVGINRTETSTPQQNTIHSTTTQEIYTTDQHTSDPGSSMSNLTSSTALPGTTTDKITAKVTITANNTGNLENSMTLYTSASLPESSSHYPEYNTTTVGINRTETTTTPQQYTIHSTTMQASSTAGVYTSSPGSSTSNLTFSTLFPGITTERSGLITSTLVTNHTEAPTLLPGNTTPNVTAWVNTTERMDNSPSLHTSPSLPEYSNLYPEDNTATVGINMT